MGNKGRKENITQMTQTKSVWHVSLLSLKPIPWPPLCEALYDPQTRCVLLLLRVHRQIDKQQVHLSTGPQATELTASYSFVFPTEV